MERQYYESLVGTDFDGRYTIEKLLGIGGMSAVYRAVNRENGNTVALKMLKRELAEDTDAVNHFINEAKAVSQLSHPNIIGIYEVSDKTPVKYLVMEYADGISLKTYMSKRGVLKYEEVVKYSLQILAALDHAHSKGIIHRDIKPQNIMLLRDGRVKLTDFGIAKVPDSEDTVDIDKAMGTVYYISPEQAESSPCDARSDLYSLGVMMYEMATGKLPFYSEHAAAVLMMHMQDKPQPPRQLNKKIPRGLEQLILCAMEKKPSKRYQSAVDMFRELRKLEKHRYATVLTPAQVAARKRSIRNRDQNPPSKSMTPVVWGIACALFVVAVVSLFTALGRLEIGSLGTVSISVPDVSGQTLLSETKIGSSAYESQLEALGLGDDYNVTVVYAYSDTVAENCIIKQNPGAGASRKSPCKITLTVSCGPEILTVEDYTIRDWREAQSLLRNTGFAVSVQYVENPVIASGYVVSTSPTPGTRLKKGSTVTLYVSNGTLSGKMVIDDYTAKSETEVAALLEKDGLFVGDVIYTRSTMAPGTVLFQSPEAGETVYAGSSFVDFVVSGGEDFNINYYPDFTGKQLAEAQLAFQKLGLSVVLRAENSNEDEGVILRQLPAVSDITETTEKVYLYYSTGDSAAREYTLKVNVTGLKLENAKLVIEKALGDSIGADFTVVYKRSSSAIDTVIAQSPAKGTTAVLSSGNLPVTLTVSGGPEYKVTVTVPYVTEMTRSEAVKELSSSGIIADIVKVASAEPVGKVLAQEYDAGTEITGLEGDIHVKITVSGGTDYTEPPETTETPAETTPSPSETTQSPAESTTVSPEITETPSETSVSPSETSASPAVTTAVPAETTGNR